MSSLPAFTTTLNGCSLAVRSSDLSYATCVLSILTCNQAFDEVAKHDVKWGSERVDWLSPARSNSHKQGYVSVAVLCVRGRTGL
jgi:hypothetical protein